MGWFRRFASFSCGIILLCSCEKGNGRTSLLNKFDDKSMANAVFGEIIEAIKTDDKAALRRIFSERARNKAGNFEASMDELFAFVTGEIVSWEQEDGPTVFEHNEYGRKTKEMTSYFNVTTDDATYFFLAKDYPIDTDHPDSVGLYLLLGVRSEDQDAVFDPDRKMYYDGKKKLDRVGIYLPLK